MAYPPHTLSWKYILHWLKSNNRHGVHSPFVYKFLDEVLYSNTVENADTRKIETLFQRLRRSTTVVPPLDLGAGANTGQLTGTVGGFARKSIIPSKQGRLLYRVARHYKPNTILELGSNLGKSLAYLSMGNPKANVVSIEGNPVLAAQATKNLHELGISNATVITSDFDTILSETLERLQTVDIAFIDGNHRFVPTIRYLNAILPYMHPDGLLIFHDIHYSREMEKAWENIVADPRLHVTMDLFFMGVAALRPDQRKEHFKLRF